jgi:phage N-6-adenine-methyltransferase
MNNPQIHTSSNERWGTPQSLFDKWNAEFNFGLDAAACEKSAKCPVYFTKEQNALVQDWSGYGSVFINPPYGRNLGKFVRKAYEESLKGITVVMLITARTDTKYWRDWIVNKAAEVRFIHGRIDFIDIDTGEPAANGATFPSALVIYSPIKHTKISWIYQ